MTTAMQRTLAQIEQTGIVPVLRGPSESAARELIVALLGNGHRIVEVTLTTPGALALIAELASREDVMVGAGTVLTEAEAVGAIKAGAKFLVSAANPAFLLPFARERDVLGVPGAATPHEVWTAWVSGAPMVKVFPIARLGGPAYIKDLKGPFPEIRLMASGGVTPNDVDALSAAGCAAVGINAAALVV